MTPAELARLERFIGYVFDDKTLLTQALTHRSFSSTNNERLEFLGDGILNFIVADNLYKKFPQAAEGQLSRLRASLVKQKTLADIARELKLSEFLVMGTGELKAAVSIETLFCQMQLKRSSVPSIWKLDFKPLPSC